MDVATSLRPIPSRLRRRLCVAGEEEEEEEVGEAREG